jgi:hypothetical protein
LYSNLKRRGRKHYWGREAWKPPPPRKQTSQALLSLGPAQRETIESGLVFLVWDLCLIINIVKVYFPVQDFGHLKSYFFQLNKFILSLPINARGLNMIYDFILFLIKFALCWLMD